MKRKARYLAIALIAIGLPALLAVTPLPAAEFSADLVRADEYGDEETVRLYVKGDLRREDVTDEGEVEGWVVYRPDKGVLWNVSPDDGIYVEVPLETGSGDVLEKVGDLETQAVRKSLGQEKLNGFECEKILYTYDDGVQGGVLVWHSEALGYPVRIVQQDLGGKALQTLELKNIDASPVPASKFEIPAGFEKMTMPAMPKMPEGMPNGMIPQMPETDDDDD